MEKNQYNSNQYGLIYLIQKYCIHDGPGIRTTVFMKGCPLNCDWCHNPESKKPYPELLIRKKQCILSKHCELACPSNAIRVAEDGPHIDATKCNLSFKCVDNCPTKAINKVGEYMSIGQVMAEIDRDELFYYRSGGGVTISGGEPLFQHKFVIELLKRCKQNNYHTALDTSGFSTWPVFQAVCKNVDLLLFDIKHISDNKHRQGTSQSNNIILNNLHKIANQIRIWIRVPLIPGYNDDADNLSNIADIANDIKADKISILPLNKFAEGKDILLDSINPFTDYLIPTEAEIENAVSILQKYDMEVTVGF